MASLVLPGRNEATLMVAAGTLAMVPPVPELPVEPELLPVSPPLPDADELAGAADELADDALADNEAGALDELAGALELDAELLVDPAAELELLDDAAPLDELQAVRVAMPIAMAAARTAADRVFFMSLTTPCGTEDGMGNRVNGETKGAAGAVTLRAGEANY